MESRNVTFLAPDFPIFWDRAEGCLITDVDGNTFLDMTAAFGVAGVGHSHPRVVAAVQAQSEKLLHGMGDVHPSEVKVALCERICPMRPRPRRAGDLGAERRRRDRGRPEDGHARHREAGRTGV